MAEKPFDLTSELDAVIGKLWVTGHQSEADELRMMVHETTWTSGSEMLGEIGLCILRIQRSLGRKIPKQARDGLARCLTFVKKTWPDIRLPKP